MQKIVPNIWFDSQAEEAAEFYTSTFKNSNILTTVPYTEVGQEIHGQTPGSVMTIDLELEGYRFSLLNAGPVFSPNPSISFFVNCESKDEVDRLWAALSEGGRTLMPLDTYPFSQWYGWVEDKFGVSWQVSVADEPFAKIVPSLLFVGDNVGKAEEAVHFYVSVFRDAEAKGFFRYEAGQEPDKAGTIAYADFMLAGQSFAAMDSAREHGYTFSEGISLIVNCDDQAEVDYYWGKLSAVPEAEQCGWLKDKYGVSWQITPIGYYDMMKDPASPGAKRAMEAMFKMKKLDIAELEKAYNG